MVGLLRVRAKRITKSYIQPGGQHIRQRGREGWQAVAGFRYLPVAGLVRALITIMALLLLILTLRLCTARMTAACGNSCLQWLVATAQRRADAED